MLSCLTKIGNCTSNPPSTEWGSGASLAQEDFGYSQIENFLANLSNNNAYTESGKLLEHFENELHYCSTVSFDIFDTLLIRYVNSPFDVFQYLATESVFRSCGIPVEQLAKSRSNAEIAARAAIAHPIGQDDISIVDIYSTFCRQHNLSLSLITEMIMAEERVELKLCRVNPPLRTLYERAVAAKKSVIYVSDMYHRPEFLKTLLEQNGFAVPEGCLFVSSAYKYNKTSRRMFKIVCDTVKQEPSKILHVGDSPEGDYFAPKSLGMRSILHRHRASAEKPDFSTMKQPFELQAFLLGMAKVAKLEYPEGNFWWHLGYKTFGPLTVAYSQWLNTCFRRDNLDHAYFLLRDMAVVADVYKMLFPVTAGGTPAVKMPSSRRAWLFAAADLIPPLAFSDSGLFYTRTPKPARVFLDRLSVNPEVFASEFAISGFTSLDELVDPREPAKLFTLIKQERVLKAILSRVEYERAELVRYLHQSGILSKNKVGIVELGWSGRPQKALQAILSKIAPNLSLHGYYLGTFSSFLNYGGGNLPHSSFLVQDGQPGDLAHYLDSTSVLLESVYTSGDGSLLHFASKDTTVEPVLAPPDLQEEQRSLVADIHAGIRKFAADYVYQARKFGFKEIPPQLGIENYLRLAIQPTAEEASRIGNLSYGENLGSAGRLPLACFRKSSESISDIWNDFEASIWKAGLLNQSNGKALALRSTLWMMEHPAGS